MDARNGWRAVVAILAWGLLAPPIRAGVEWVPLEDGDFRAEAWASFNEYGSLCAGVCNDEAQDEAVDSLFAGPPSFGSRSAELDVCLELDPGRARDLRGNHHRLPPPRGFSAARRPRTCSAVARSRASPAYDSFPIAEYGCVTVFDPGGTIHFPCDQLIDEMFAIDIGQTCIEVYGNAGLFATAEFGPPPPQIEEPVEISLFFETIVPEPDGALLALAAVATLAALRRRLHDHASARTRTGHAIRRRRNGARLGEDGPQAGRSIAADGVSAPRSGSAATRSPGRTRCARARRGRGPPRTPGS